MGGHSPFCSLNFVYEREGRPTDLVTVPLGFLRRVAWSKGDP